MNELVDNCLRAVERATARLGEIDPSDLAALARAFADRATSIDALARALGPEHQGDVELQQRLTTALSGGNDALLRLSGIRRAVSDELAGANIAAQAARGMRAALAPSDDNLREWSA